MHWFQCGWDSKILRRKKGEDGRVGFLWGVLVWLALAIAAGVPSAGQELSALARLDVARSFIRADGIGVTVQLALSQPVPWRVVTLDEPPRVVLDFREVDFGRAVAGFMATGAVQDVRTGALRPGWSRMVLELTAPFAVRSATMDTAAGGAVVTVTLAAVSQAVFAATVSPADVAGWDLGKPAAVERAKRRQTGEAPLVVVLDPGHGGIDPGAERDGQSEAGLMLTFSRSLREALVRAGMTVVMTREQDAFVPLETRISVARAAGADAFLSLHADAIAEGVARGATVYTLSDTATDAASEALAERHDRADLLAGVDLSGQDDLIAGVLMDMARVETGPRADRLADALVGAIKQAKLDMHKRPRLGAAFSVLKSPDIPSVLLELGFLSSARDMANLQDTGWRDRMVGAIVSALQTWAVADAAEAVLLRQ